MMTWPGHSTASEPLPRTLRYCKSCQKHTPHELRTGAGVVAVICVPCLERALNYELDRD